MDGWDEFGDGSEATDLTEISEPIEEVPMDTLEVSDVMDNIEPLENVEELAEPALDVDTDSYVDSVMDSAEVEALEFDDAQQIEDVMDEGIEFETAQNQILDIPEMQEPELEVTQDIVDEVLEEHPEMSGSIEEATESGNLEIYPNEPELEVTQDIVDEVLEEHPEMSGSIEEVAESGNLEIYPNEPELEVTQDTVDEVLEERPEMAGSEINSWNEGEVVQIEHDEEAVDNQIENSIEDATENTEVTENTLSVMDGVESDDVEFEDEITDSIEEPEAINEVITQQEALDNMADYMNSHDYGLEDYATYSQDPEWQALNRDLQVADGYEVIEPEAENNDAGEFSESIDPHEALDSMAQYMNEHNYGLEDYAIYSQDPEWQALNHDLQIADGIEMPESTDTGIEQEIEEAVEPRVFDEFEQSVLENNPEFYETGQFYEQGINEFGYEGTCGPTSQANAINELLETNELTENKVLSVAIDNNLCNKIGEPGELGGTSTEQFMELYDKMNEELGDRFNTELYEMENVLDANQVAQRLESGDVVNVAVDACALWNQPRNYVDNMGVRHDDFASDHWITVTGVNRSGAGEIEGFNIIDSGGGESFVSLDKYNEMCFGTPEHRVIDPTCIVLSKKV